MLFGRAQPSHLSLQSRERKSLCSSQSWEPSVHHGLNIKKKLSLKAIAIFPLLFTFYCD